MTAPILPHDATFVGRSFATAAGIGNVLADPVAHAINVARALGAEPCDWTDAALSETRRHLELSFSAAEAALRDALGEGELALPVTRLPLDSAWSRVQVAPALVGADLLAHMRVRAAVGLLARWTGEASADGAPAADPDLQWLQADDDREIALQAARLAAAERRWSATRLETADPASALDFPRDILSDLVWTAASLLGQALCAESRRTMADVLPAIVRASDAVIAAYHGRCPIEGATVLAALLASRPEAGAYLGQAVAQRRLLPFAALAAEYLSIPADRLLHVLVHAPAEEIAGVCHALGGSPSDYQHLLMQLRVARASLTDGAVLSLVDHYQGMTDAAAKAVLDRLRCPAGLCAKIDLAQRIGAV